MRTPVRVCQRLRGLQANRKSMTIGLPAVMPSSYEIKVPKPYGFGTFFGSGRRIRTLTYGVRVRCATITQSRYVRLTNICYYTSGFAFVKNYLPSFRIFFILVPRAVFDLRFSGKAARTARAGRGLREERWETGAQLGCFGGRKICFFFGFGENADSLLHFKLLYCIHQGFREEHRP